MAENGEVAVAAIDNADVAVAGNTRPRRANTGAGVERIHIDFSDKDYGSK